MKKNINIIKIASGGLHSLCFSEEGDLFTWGYNGYYQQMNGSTASELTPKKIDYSPLIKKKENLTINIIKGGYYNSFILIDYKTISKEAALSFDLYRYGNFISNGKSLLINCTRNLKLSNKTKQDYSEEMEEIKLNFKKLLDEKKSEKKKIIN